MSGSTGVNRRARATIMATGKMYDCEVKRPFVRNGVRGLDWIRLKVRHVDDGAEVRCMHCHGEVRVHRKRSENGPEDHVEHRSADDSKHCKGGAYFHGTDAEHRMSPKPVT